MIRKIDTKRESSRFVIHQGLAVFTGHISPFADDLRGQSEDILYRYEELMSKFNLKKENIIYYTAYLKDISKADEVNDVWNTWVIRHHEPAGIIVQAVPNQSLPYGDNVQLELSLIVAMEENDVEN